MEGRERKKTPPCPAPDLLPPALVKYALGELLSGKTADEILSFRICDPHMVNAAFLREAADRLAEAYLSLKQEETGVFIPDGEYHGEKEKVRSRIARKNLFGVAPDPASLSHARASLGKENAENREKDSVQEAGLHNLSAMDSDSSPAVLAEAPPGTENADHREKDPVQEASPHLVCGNALIGAGRRVFDARLLRRTHRTDHLWLDQVPLRVMPGEKRPDHTVFHFLLPDRGMANYRDRVVREIAEDALEKIKAWRKAFLKPLSVLEIKQLESLSREVDRLWERQSIDRESTCRRLKLVMDYWCALFFWPVEKAALLPTRYEYLKDLALILTGSSREIAPSRQLSLFPEAEAKVRKQAPLAPDGCVDVDSLCANSERLGRVASLGLKYRFHHWELVFADLFTERGGFDLVIGNPPWSHSSWKESGVPGEKETPCAKSDSPAKGLNELRKELPENPHLRQDYLDAFEKDAGRRNFLSAGRNDPHLRGSKPEVHKCFLSLSWMIARGSGISGLLLPEGIYDGPKEGRLREALFFRLRSHFQFRNEKRLIAGLPRHTRFGISICGSKKSSIDFSYIADLEEPRTIDDCLGQNGQEEPPDNLDGESTGDLKGHPGRVIRVGEEELALFARMFEEEGTPAAFARLPALYAKESVRVLKKLSDCPKKMGDLKDRCFSTRHWKETDSLKDGTLLRETCFPGHPDRLILSAAHFSVGNPFFKTPGSKETKGSRFLAVDLPELPDDYLPRTLHVPECDPAEYHERSPRVPWYDKRPVTEYYRFVNREAIGPSAERALVPIIIPKGAGHIHTCLSTVFKNIYNLVDFYCISLSIPVDFPARAAGAGHADIPLIRRLPLLTDNRLRPLLHARALMLCCLTRHYSEIWSDCYDPEFNGDRWAKSDPRLPDDLFEDLTPQWNRNIALRTDYQRRQALVEIDVLSAVALGITLEELKILYRVQFPELRQNENDTWYDKKGRIVFTPNRELAGKGFAKKEWTKVRDMKEGTVERIVMDDTLPHGPVERSIFYHAPFDCCDREKDYEDVWARFDKRLG